MNTIQDRLIEIYQNMDNAYEAYAKAHGLTYLSLMVLEEIFFLGDGCTQKQISEDTHYPKQSVNLVIRAFLEEGLLSLRELPENRKNKGIYLTESGRKRCQEVVTPLWQLEDTVISELGADDSRELLGLLERYGEAYCRNLGEL